MLPGASPRRHRCLHSADELPADTLASKERFSAPLIRLFPVLLDRAGAMTIDVV